MKFIRGFFKHKKRFNKKLFLAFLFIFIFSFSNIVNAAGTPSIISYQGRLADSSGNLLGGSGTTYYFKFSIWDDSTVGSGNKLWPAGAPGSTSLTVRSGVFNANIGDTAAGFPDTLDYNFNSEDDVYLQIEVSSDNATFQTLSPRQRIGSTPFSQLSGAVSGTGQSSFGALTPISGSVVSVVSTTTNSIALSIRGVLGQVADLLQIKNSNGDNLFSVNSAGLATFSTASTTALSALNSLSVGTTATTTIRGELNATSTFAGGVDITRGLNLNSGYIYGAGLTSCSAGTDKLLYNATTGQFSCGTDAGAGSGISSLGALGQAQTGAGQTFATSTDTNIGLTITSAGDVHTFTSTWSGVL
ncbi:MAG: hypothetical protein QG585_438, partial [Patescibacteria group bacterium]|nr:hypothetical protein [Patescibacteria group bacterium]